MEEPENANAEGMPKLKIRMSPGAACTLVARQILRGVPSPASPTSPWFPWSNPLISISSVPAFVVSSPNTVVMLGELLEPRATAGPAPTFTFTVARLKLRVNEPTPSAEEPNKTLHIDTSAEVRKRFCPLTRGGLCRALVGNVSASEIRFWCLDTGILGGRFRDAPELGRPALIGPKETDGPVLA